MSTICELYLFYLKKKRRIQKKKKKTHASRGIEILISVLLNAEKVFYRPITHYVYGRKFVMLTVRAPIKTNKIAQNSVQKLTLRNVLL